VTSAFLDERFDREIMSEMGKLGLLGADHWTAFRGTRMTMAAQFDCDTQDRAKKHWGLACQKRATSR
jgi:hypothetical protein